MKPSLQQVTAARLSEILDMSRSGVSDLTGKLRRSHDDGRHEQGAIVGRYGGLRIPELVSIGMSPGQAAKAIVRGKGKVYGRLVKEVKRLARSEGYTPARKKYVKKRGPLSIAGHEKIRPSCSLCKFPHTKKEHRFHGPGSYQRTHGGSTSFSFGENPMKAINWVWGVFVWRSDNKYSYASAVKIFKHEKVAEKYVRAHDPHMSHNWVVRNVWLPDVQNRRRRNPSTSTATRTATRTATSTKAHTAGNVTVTGGAGAGANTTVTVRRNPPRSRVTFHGSFTSEILARRRKIAIPGSRIIKRRGRFYVMKQHGRKNPPRKGRTLIYGRVLRIEAQKTQGHRCDAGCKRANHRYYHDFKKGPKLYGNAQHTKLTIE